MIIEKYFNLINIKTYFFLLLSIGLLMSCSNDMKKVDALVGKKELNVEIAKDVEILYSDSAVVRMKITAPEMHRYLNKTNPKEEWPLGVHVDFYDMNKNPSAWLDAKKAVRLPKKNKIIVEDSVVLFNQRGDLLKSPKLIWDQTKELLYTDEYVQIIQSENNDTIHGYGFETDKEFKIFKIKNKFSTKRHVGLLSEALK